MTDKNVIMQVKCIYCKREQYSPAIYPISIGEAGCSWCGKVPPVFTNHKLYWEAVNKNDSSTIIDEIKKDPTKS